MANVSFDQAYPSLYQGWDRSAAQADFTATGGRGKAGYDQLAGGSSSTPGAPSSSNPIDLARQLNQFNVSQNQPAISSLQSSIPEIGNKFAAQRTALAAEKDPLKSRYQNILDQIKGNQTTSENRQTVTTNNEISRRGIPLSSGVAQQELTQSLNPITQQYTGMYKDAGLAQEEGLRNIDNQITGLTGQETDQTRAVQNAIAQLQAGNPSASVTAALQQIQSQATQNLANQTLTAQQKQQEVENAIKQATLAIQQGQLANDNKMTTYKTNAPYFNPADTFNLKDVMASLTAATGGNNSTPAPAYFTPVK